MSAGLAPSHRLLRALDQLREREETGIAPFLTAGDGGIERTAALLRSTADAGAACIELGMPFRDPVADGPLLRAAARRSLDRGMRFASLLALAREFREDGYGQPLCCFSYAGVLFARGLESTLGQLAEAGFDALIVPDLPLEELAGVAPQAHGCGLAVVPFATPLSPEDRVRAATRVGSGFLYAIPRVGLTGARSAFSPEALAWLEHLRQVSGLALAAGFGIRDASQVQSLRGRVELAICGTELARRIEPIDERSSAADVAARLVAELRGAFPIHSTPTLDPR